MPRAAGPAIALAVFAVAAVAARAVLYRDLPALVGNDSWDYLRAAGDILRHGDFSSPGLRDVRLPGYATFLAAMLPVTGLRSDAIMLVQAGVGLVTVLVGWAIGSVLRSRLVSVSLVAFLGLNPAYLVNEHAILSEGFALLLYASVVLLALVRLGPAAGWRSALGLGIVLGLATLTRANVVVLGAVLALAAGVVEAPRSSPRGMTRATRIRRGLVPLLVASVVIAPWIWRNRVVYGRTGLYASTNSNVLLYKNMHAPLDPSTPILSRTDDALGYHWVDFEWQQRLQATFPAAEAERLASGILREQIAAHPWRHLADVADSAAGFLGFNRDHGDERTAMRWWLGHLVRDVAAMNRLPGEQADAVALTGLVYGPRDRDTRATRIFGRLGVLWLCPGRAIAFVLVAGLAAVYVVRCRRSGRHATHRATVAVLAAAYVGTVAMHALMVVDYDRYSTGFDFVIVLVGALVVGDLLAMRRWLEADRRSTDEAWSSLRGTDERVALPESTPSM